VDIGESLVGAYLRHIVGCQVVTYNSYFTDRQGEVDVVGLRHGEPRTVWLCEVTTHTGGMFIVRNGKDVTAQVISEKLKRLHAFAELTFPGDHHRYEWWSPRVPVGKVTTVMASMEVEWGELGRELEFVINEAYTARLRELAHDAGNNSSTTNEPAYRMLQVLSRLRGGRFQL
jgi:hypothetical protein